MVSRHGLLAIAMFAVFSAPAVAQDGDPMARYLEWTRGAIHCTAPTAEEIVVCARRAADRYRTPIVQRAAGDPLSVDAWASARG